MIENQAKVYPKANQSFTLLIACTAALGGFLFGFDTAIINGAIKALYQAFNATSWTIGLAVSLALLGSAVGAFYAGPIADRFGRIKTMIVASVLFTISAIGAGAAFGIWDFILWRVVGGIGVGAASVIAPAYIAEVSPAHLRGRLGSLQQLAIVIGIFIALLCDYAIALAAGSAGNPWLFGVSAWRWMFWSEIPPALLYGIGGLIIPESPRYLVAQKKEEEAATVLAKVIGGDVQTKISEIRETVLRERKPKLSDLLSRNGGLLPIVWVGIGLSLLQQFVGINVIFYYSSILWQAVGFSEQDSLWITVITGATNIVTTLIAIAVVDKFGRRPLLLLGSLGMTITLGIMAITFNNAPIINGQPTLSGTTGTLALVAANLYVFCFGFSWGPVVWVLLGEIFNNKIRASALAVAASIQWVANFIVSTTFPPLLTTVGLGSAYALYGIAAAISFFFVWFFIQETKGKELEEM
ncbi:sugar porter family MFS transporter [Gloeothece verrucosa]|uniref:Sugar transporter n=1 Tax=Gloeothece verrucosa (strain PCC 7822) TaxID=497965 RepID=E0ULG3_GLOV7|nr:sugar porter family MFS transporter [Gloeothece verrucosa]ADN17793.1 sugar transporter [Gloeothece verrucosa PCC 7822]